MPHLPTRFAVRRHRPLAIWLAAVCLLLAQALALLHGGGHRADRPVPSGRLPSLQAMADSPWVQLATAGHDEGGLWCQVLDQLAHAGPVVLPPLLPAPPQVAAEEARPVEARLATAPPAAYEARAPPRQG
ncbi:hypothetical protein [Aquabacterium sp. J223]|uniref:hypothetical protein n=1 Tax=Aquabacterium sp. J223 TaxID=2898431 RepID=UPI0021AD98EE|nr:hypothetical protein [Aquabacterium sp. J223]UUX94593.1 hypothetical protein LRS07_14975 [Aquabacterium sp. J223]